MKRSKLIQVLLIFLLISGSSLFAQEKFRTEVDLLGEVKVPIDAYYGPETARAMENFQISNRYINDFPDVIKGLGRDITGYDLVNADDMIAATSSLHAYVVYSSALKTLATALSKISNDLIILSSGPRNGIFEINLPPRQPGSSIMPGKINPVMPELMNLISHRVIGNDVTVSIAASEGDLQLNAYEPVVGLTILESQEILGSGTRTFREKCVDGITINKDVDKENLKTTMGIVTALNPVLGHHVGDQLVKEAMQTGKGILELVREKKLLTEEQIKEIFSAENLTGLKKMKYEKK